MRRIVIVGAGLAGVSAAEELRRQGYEGDVVIVGAEPHMPYRRPPLSKHPVPTTHAELALTQADRLDATWVLGEPASGLDPHRRIVLANGAEVGYDGLVIATGVRARQLPDHVHRGLAQVMTLRDFDDLMRLRPMVDARPRVVILGGGFLGSELAGSLRALGLDVDLVVRDALPLIGPLGKTLAQRVADEHQRHGVGLYTGRSVTHLSGRDRLEAVHLDDGTVLTADLLITAIGSVPETAWLEDSGLAADDGVVVDQTGTAAPGIVAAGDVARWPHPWNPGTHARIEHYNGAVSQGAHVARTLLGEAKPYQQPPSFWAHIHDLRLHSIGFTGASYQLEVVDDTDGRFLAEYLDGDVVVGAITHGRIRHLARYRELLRR